VFIALQVEEIEVKSSVFYQMPFVGFVVEICTAIAFENVSSAEF
jgi:hypothetical protein